MPHLDANGIRIEYETFGDPRDRPLLLIMGLGQQMIVWHDGFCELLAERGHHVVRFDNRDVGGSTIFDAAGVPSLFGVALRFWTGRDLEPVYTLDDMADDAAGLARALGFERVHLVGASMGGIIAQACACRHRGLVASLTSVMANTGRRWGSLPTLAAMRAAFQTPPAERDAYVDYSVELWRTIGSPGYPYREDEVRRRSGRVFDRGANPAGLARQLVAVAAAGDRRRDLATLDVPTLVIHGEDDPLVPVRGGRETARAIPGARLLTFEGMGHDLPMELWPEVADAIGRHTREAERDSASGASPDPAAIASRRARDTRRSPLLRASRPG